MTKATGSSELVGLVYVPGVWRCAKCKFTLIQSNLNANDGSVTARDEPGDKCPNDGSPLWRVSYRDWALENEKVWGELLERKNQEIAALRSTPPEADLRAENEDTISVSGLLDWIAGAWPSGSGSDFNQGVVRGFEIIRAQLQEGHIQRYCAALTKGAEQCTR